MGLKKLASCFKPKNDKKQKLQVENLVKQYETEDHKKSLEELRDTYKTDFKNGLTDAQVAEATAKYGKNLLTPAKQTPIIVKFLKTVFLNVFNLLLDTGAVLCFISYAVSSENDENLYLAIVLSGVVLVTAAFTTYQEFSSGKKLEGFKNLLPPHVNIYRNGEMCNMLAKEIVPGDVLVLKAGDKVPADLRVVAASLDAKVDNSSITGESEPLKRAVENTHDEPLETQNLCFFGTLMVQGHVTAMAIKTGDRTLIGNIAKLTSSTSDEKTPIGKEINRFVKIISVIAVILGVILGTWNGIATKEAIPTIVFFIGIIVANVPEGLLATLTVSLTLASKRMTKKSVLVKNLECVETLGSTSVICSDKTGTLTINKMTVSHIFYDGREREVDTHNPKNGDFEAGDPIFKKLIRVATLCNNAKYNKDRIVVGDASESALIKFANPHLSVPLDEYRESNKQVHSIPFNSKNKWQLSIHESQVADGSETNIVVMKGAPERIISFCSKVYADGKAVPFDEDQKAKVKAGILSLAKQGERVLGLCECLLDSEKFPRGFKFEGDSPEKANFSFELESPEDGYVFVGLSAMIDPPRPSVPQSVLKCQSAGIRVFMVTGDHPTTARAIATKVNIIFAGDKVLDFNESDSLTLGAIEASDADACVVTGSHINQFIEDVSADERARFWNAVLKHRRIVFSRTSPQHKLLIVKACQQRNGIVAVTGDGVNDSPALKRADIGIAMGIAGTDVAKDAANMILMDDNFSSIVNGVEEGRVLFDNLKKSIAYTLSSNIPEISPAISSFILGIPLPLQTIQILVIDLGTDMVPAISMSYEKKESDIMSHPPRNPKKENLVNRNLIFYSYLLIGMIQMFAGFFTYLVVFHFAGFGFYQLFKLDQNGRYLSCSPENTYLSCADTARFDGEYCTYTSSPISGSGLTVVNMQCDERKRILNLSNAAYVISIVIVQVADVMISKTRRNSVFSQGMGNIAMNIGIVLEIALICLLVYAPPIARVFSFRPVGALMWVAPLPFFIIIFCFDEARKLLIRRNFNGWVKRNTYW